jgi:hypothetical protein
VEAFARHRVDVDVDDQHVLFVGRRRRDEVPVGVVDERCAVEDELVLAPQGVDVSQRDDIIRRARREHPFAEVVDAGAERRSVDVDDHLGPRPRLPLGGTRWIPNVLTDAHSDLDAGDHEDGGAVAACEVPVLVEDAVRRQVVLVVDAAHLAVRADGGGVVEVAVEVGESDDGSDALRRGRDLPERLLVRADECGLEEQVFGGIPRDNELGKGDDVGVGGARPLDRVPDDLGVSFDVADRRVHLSERETQRPHTTIVRSER